MAWQDDPAATSQVGRWTRGVRSIDVNDQQEHLVDALIGSHGMTVDDTARLLAITPDKIRWLARRVRNRLIKERSYVRSDDPDDAIACAARDMDGRIQNLGASLAS